MTAITFDEALNHFEAYCDKAIDDAEEIVIVREPGKNVVLISQDDWDAIQETLYVLEDDIARAEFKESIKQAQEGKVYQFSSREELMDYVTKSLRD